MNQVYRRQTPQTVAKPAKKTRARQLFRVITVLLIIVLSIFLTVAISQTMRDTSAPQLTMRVPERVPASLPITVTPQADETATYRLHYAGRLIDNVSAGQPVQIVVQSGWHTLDVTATDASANSATYQFQIYGLPTIIPDVTVVDEIIPGEPLGIAMRWLGDGVELQAVEVRLGGEAVPTFRNGQTATALVSVPLGAEAETVPIDVNFVDIYNRTVSFSKILTILPDPRPVQNLNISTSSSIWQAVTPENQALERQVVENARMDSSAKDRLLWSEPFMLPIEGRSTSGYGSPRTYVQGGRVSYHHGTDIAAPAGTPVQATNTGIVVAAEFYPIKGGFVMLDHGGGLFSRYLHQSKITVTLGETVARGQIIGEVGSTGLSTGPHLHWEMRLNGVSTNPMSWVDNIVP